jgi:hypothetical protein
LTLFGKGTVVDIIDRSAENKTDRRRFLRSAGLAGIGTLGAGALGGMDRAVATGGRATPPS